MVMTKPDVMPTFIRLYWLRLYDFMKNSFLQSSGPPATLVAECQSPRDPGISVSLVVRNTQRWGSRSVKKVKGPISKTRMLSGGSWACPQPEKYMLCTFRKKSSTRNPWPLHQDSMAKLSTQSFSLWYLLQKNIRQDIMSGSLYVIVFIHHTWSEQVYNSLFFSGNEDLAPSYSAQLKMTNS